MRLHYAVPEANLPVDPRQNHKDKHRGLLSLEIMRVFYKDDHKRIKQRPFGIPFMMLRCSQFKEIMMPLTCAPPEVQRSMGGETW
jgi:hypothetical protein